MLILSFRAGSDDSSIFITIFSMLFTIISIVLSLFEFIFSRKFIKSKSLLIIRFSISSSNVRKLKYSEFQSKIIFRRLKFLHGIAKILNINKEFVERLIPLQTKDGAMFTLVVQCSAQNFDVTESLMDAATRDGSLAKVCCYTIF